jgi:hypothetical protein
MEDICIFYGDWVYFTAIWYILCQFGIFYGYLVYFSSFGTKKIWQPCQSPTYKMSLSKEP